VNITEDRQRSALQEAKSLLQNPGEAGPFTVLCKWLRSSFAQYDWVGVYLLEGDSLFLAAWAGENATEHVTIPLAMGICGMAARERKTINVRDVRTRPEYLACFLDTRSEIVVPILDGAGRCLGEIDIDGKAEGAYDASDESFLQKVAVECVPPAKAALKAAPWRA
jgi:L-methionine (R)-S-oxide reductase